ncbi:MAG: gephyrin-like molybdotransferase Glp [Gammaproteobacteria bacterium]
MSTHSLSLEQAWARLEAAVPDERPAVENVAVANASGRILAENVTARVDSPPADNSAMDGFVVKASDVVLDSPVALSQRIAAGHAPVALEPGTAARIFTGAEIPDGADCVVIQENCEYDEDSVSISQGLTSGANIRRRASDVAIGDVVARQHAMVRPQEIGLLLSSGVGQVAVYGALRVGIIATGDELVDIANAPAELPPGKIYESNSPMIAARLQAMGCVPTRYRALDTHEDTVRVMSEALAENDAVLTIGGVSVGEEDHVLAALQEVGQTEFWKINIKPGKPFLFGSGAGKPVMGLPGNPVSSFVTFTLFCAPFIQQLQGGTFERPTRIPAVADFSRSRTSDRVDHLRGRITSRYPELIVEPVGSQSSSVQGALCAADVLIVVPADTQVIEGQRLRVIPL